MAPPLEVAVIPVAVPAVVMFETLSVTSTPVARKKVPVFIARPDPGGTFIRGARPVTVMPPVLSSIRIPVAIYP